MALAAIRRWSVCAVVAGAIAMAPGDRLAAARPGLDLKTSVAIARKARVPVVVFVTQGRRVVVEEWHSYTTPTQTVGPAWTIAEAHTLRRLLIGDAVSVAETERRVGWASFPVWAFAYPNDQWVLYESKRQGPRVWGILAAISWSWTDALTLSFVMPPDTRGWKLLNGKLIPTRMAPSHNAPPPSPVYSRPTPTPGFYSPFRGRSPWRSGDPKNRP